MTFTLLEERAIPEIASSARMYRHDKTGARLLSVINGDENKSFGITFRTPPATSHANTASKNRSSNWRKVRSTPS